MAFERASTSLSFVEERLRRFFGLAGRIDSKFDPHITPVVVVGTLDDPGVSSFRGRHWAYVSDKNAGPAPGGTHGIGLTLPVATLIRGFGCLGLAAGGYIDVFYVSPDETLPYPGARPAATWIDQRTAGAERTPYSDSGAAWVAAAGGAPAVAVTNLTARFGGQTVGSPYVDQQGKAELHFPANSQLAFNCGSVVAGSLITVFAWGQVF